MTRRPAPLTSLRRALSLRERPRRGEDGFILLESIVAISLVTVLMGALASFTLNAIQATTELRARQGAVQLATSAMATISALPPSDLVRGRGESAVGAQWGSAATKVKPLLRAMDEAFDETLPLPPTTLPLTPTPQTFNGIAYRTSTYVGTCNLRTPGSSATATECVETGTGPQHLRVVLAVEWSNRACRGGGCVYTTTSLVNADSDPVFNSNRANPPVPPVIRDPGNQVSTIGRPQNLQLALEPGSGLDPHTWESVTLPTGLGVGSSTGVVSGIPTVLGGPTAVTVRVADVFGRADTATFGWTVVAEPTITTPGSRSTVRGQAVSLAVTSTCPNAPCTYAAAGLPAGLGINTANGTVSGTPTTSGTSSVTITITDSDGAAVTTTPFSWIVYDPPLISLVSTFVVTEGFPATANVPYYCGTTTCTITLTNPVPGLGLSTTPGRTDLNTTTSLTVGAGNGSLYVTGTVASNAVTTGNSRTYAVTVTIADGGGRTASATGTWTAKAGDLVNYALLRPTVQSSTNSSTLGPERAVDGNTDGNLANGSLSSTNSTFQPWWQVDLGATSTVSSVELWNRTDASSNRLANGYVFLSNGDMRNRTYAALLADPTVTKLPFGTLTGPSIALAADDVRARYARVQLTGTNFLTLAEVRVLGPNLAAGQGTSQSSLDFGGNPSRAVDSDLDGVYNNGSVTHTAFTAQPWWQVDLGGPAEVDAVTVWNRTDCCADRLNGAVLLLSTTDMTGRTPTQLANDPAVIKIPFGTAAQRTTIPVTTGTTARFVRVQLQSGNQALSLAEVQVNGTTP